MKKFLFLVAVPAILFCGFCAFVPASAQTLQSSYFLDNYAYSYQLNPAAVSEKVDGFFGLGVDNLYLGANSNLGLSSVLFPVVEDGQKILVTGLHELVDADIFLNGLDPENVLDLNVGVNLLSFGHRSRRSSGFFTFELNVKSDIGATVPKEVFSLLKLGGSRDDKYVINDIALNTTNYVEAVFGYSAEVSRSLRLGGRLHILGGLADASVSVPQAVADVSGNLSIDASGSLDVYAGNFSLPSTPDGYLDMDRLDFDFEEAGIGGYGAAMDFGLAYSSGKLSFDASVLDLGGVYWLKGNSAEANYSGTLDADDFDPATIFRVTDQTGGKFLGLGPRVNVGARYNILPSVSVGLLGTKRFGRYSWTEARAGLTFTPAGALSLAVTGGVNDFGPCFGAALNLHLFILDLYLGTDSVITSFTPQLLPVNQLHTRLSAGLLFSW